MLKSVKKKTSCAISNWRLIDIAIEISVFFVMLDLVNGDCTH